ncbi:MAG: hypothetical protein ACI9Y1_003014 [Lentisphaeria bacterium]
MSGIGPVDSGRHFLQAAEEVHGEPLLLSTYFKPLKSQRRTNMLEMFEKQSYALHGKTLAWLEIDYLRQFQELDQYTVEAADGHFIDHVCHTEKGADGKVYAACFIYSMNLRNGPLKALCCITNGTKRNHEIPVLRNHIEKQNKEANKPEKCLYVYDKAVTDYVWWNHQTRHENYMISVLKENSVATFFESIPFDKSNKINIGVEGYSIYENGGIKFSVVDYRDPETQKCHRFVTTLPTASINPVTIAMLYYKRWTMEKALNNSKSNLNEKKAWSPDVNALKNPMRFTSMSYNLMRVHEEVSMTQDTELIHPSDKKYTKALEKRELIAKKRGGFINLLFFEARIVCISPYTTRVVPNAILAGKSFVWVMSVLVARLISRTHQIGKH